nr:MAG TPA_asm: hypothetical protein [Caudoviricetes sp.]
MTSILCDGTLASDLLSIDSVDQPYSAQIFFQSFS